MSVAIESDEARFLALGDSYTIGEGVQPADRWPVQLARLLREQGIELGEPTIIAKTGWTTRELMAGVDRAKPEGTFQLVTLLIGVNNQFRGRSEAEYRKELAEILRRAVQFAGGEPSRAVVFSIPDWGITPFAEGRDRARISSEIDRFNEINREEARRVGAHYVDVTPTSRQAANDSTLLAADGLHPSGNQYKKWAGLALPAARKALKRD